MSLILDRLRDSTSLVIFILLNPSWNKAAAIALYVSAGALLLLVIVAAVFLALGKPKATARPTAVRPETDTGELAARPVVPPVSPLGRWLAALGTLIMILAIWVAASYSTADSRVCQKCHSVTSPHAKATKRTDPHVDVDCVSCHEPGGAVGRYALSLPSRAFHIAQASMGASPTVDYGRLTVRACTECHSEQIQASSISWKRMLKISHKEPMAAWASCMDCHRPQRGVIASYNAGMNPCLRCHDGRQVSAACKTCHVRKVTASARPRATSFRAQRIKNVSCGGCHDEKRECDSCHGMRMPHTDDFMLHTHARAAAVDIWYNNGKVCGRCHSQDRRPCRCHTGLMGKAHGTNSGMGSSHQDAAMPACNACHQRYAYVATRDFCRDVCHSAAAVAASPR